MIAKDYQNIRFVHIPPVKHRARTPVRTPIIRLDNFYSFRLSRGAEK